MKVISMYPESQAMKAKKERLRKILKEAWQYCKNEGLSLSSSMRKAWVLATAPADRVKYSPNLFDNRCIDLVLGASFIGAIRILDDGFISGRNKNNCSQIFRCRHEALKYALSNQKAGAAAQLPLL